MWHGTYYVGGWPMLLGGFLFFGSILALIAWAVHRVTDRGDAVSYPTKPPLEHLKDRYARGEITRDEFEQIKRDLLS